MWLLDARVNHFDQDVGVLVEVDHQLLRVLHRAEAIFVYQVRIVKEKVVL